MTVSKEEMDRAILAGWNPADGDPPYKHGEFVDGLDAVTNINDLDRLFTV